MLAGRGGAALSPTIPTHPLNPRCFAMFPRLPSRETAESTLGGDAGRGAWPQAGPGADGRAASRPGHNELPPTSPSSPPGKDARARAAPFIMRTAAREAQPAPSPSSPAPQRHLADPPGRTACVAPAGLG
ncbi:unnamed protein product [Rangifer tarandus platyrhynchus]|uniref:Uncharacterized protein n=1 Tax=Rangifer tarandus platyrhynchus TaxID=3082113 RepID=A0ABN8ZM91_RANTA|nr:unnamed protein product [Rangifer tarandus platyrhynchus]